MAEVCYRCIFFKDTSHMACYNIISTQKHSRMVYSWVVWFFESFKKAFLPVTSCSMVPWHTSFSRPFPMLQVFYGLFSYSQWCEAKKFLVELMNLVIFENRGSILDPVWGKELRGMCLLPV